MPEGLIKVKVKKFSASPFANKISVSYKPVTLNELNCSCLPYKKHLIKQLLSQSIWENLDVCRVYRAHCVRSVLKTSFKILPYRPPVRLIRSSFQVDITSVPKRVSFHNLSYENEFFCTFIVL